MTSWLDIDLADLRADLSNDEAELERIEADSRIVDPVRRADYVAILERQIAELRDRIARLERYGGRHAS